MTARKRVNVLKTLIENSEKARSYDFSLTPGTKVTPITGKGMIIRKPNPKKSDYYFNM